MGVPICSGVEPAAGDKNLRFFATERSSQALVSVFL